MYGCKGNTFIAVYNFYKGLLPGSINYFAPSGTLPLNEKRSSA